MSDTVVIVLTCDEDPEFHEEVDTGITEEEWDRLNMPRDESGILDILHSGIGALVARKD